MAAARFVLCPPVVYVRKQKTRTVKTIDGSMTNAQVLSLVGFLVSGLGVVGCAYSTRARGVEGSGVVGVGRRRVVEEDA
jgi:hypothetical protein